MYKKILLSIDLNDSASWEKALPVALEHCQAFGAELLIVTVVPDLPIGIVNSYMTQDAGTQMVRAFKEKLKEFVEQRIPTGFKVSPHVGHGTVYRVILETAEKFEADLIIMASHRPAMSDYLLGPNAARVVRHSPLSVLVVRS
mgnify:CR=1 FL=1